MRQLSSVGFMLFVLAGCALFPREHYAVFFEPQSSDLDDSARQIIADVAHKASLRPSEAVTVSGFTDPDGSVPDNKLLAARRARAVSAMLIADGVDPARIKRHAVGGIDYAMDSVESRRVEIMLGAP